MLLARKVALSSRLPSLRSPFPSIVALGRALAATLVLAVWAMCATPRHPYDHELLSTPRNARILDVSSRTFAWLGLHVTSADLADALVTHSTAAIALRDRALEPLHPVLDLLGVHQRWGLFLMGGRDVYRLQLEGRRAGGEFELLFRSHQHDALELGELLGYRRVRGIYNPRGKRKAPAQYDGFVAWVADRTFAREPDVCEVRVGMVRERLATREAPNRPLDVRHVRTRQRGDCS
jgi:hypothetical protein